MRRLFFGCAAAFLAAAGAAQPVALDDLLDAADSDPTVLEARANYDASVADQAVRRAEAGPQLFLNASAGHYRELNSANLIDDYYSRHVAVGVRFPLLGTLQRQRDALSGAEFESQRRSLQLALQRAERRLALRMNYADWWRSQQELRFCSDIKKTAAAAIREADQRQAVAWIRRSEALSEKADWKAMLARCEAAGWAEQDYRSRLSLLTGRTLGPDAIAVAVPLRNNPAPLERWQARIDLHPGVQGEQTRIEENRQLRGQGWSRSVDASVSLGYGIEDRSGVSRFGNNFIAALNFSIPFSIGEHASGRNNAAAARYQAARHRVAVVRRQLLSELSSALLGVREASLAVIQVENRLQAAESRLAEQEARLALEEEDGIALRQAAQLALAQTRLDHISSWHTLWIRTAGLHMFTDDGEQDAALLGSSELKWPVPGAKSAGASAKGRTAGRDGRPRSAARSPAPTPATGRQGKDWTVGTYVWDSRLILNPASRQAELNQLKAAGISRIYLGLNARQVAELQASRHALAAVLKQAASNGMEVSLLLGDPAWLEPAHRKNLLVLVEALADLPFARLHLDLEVEQLGWPVPTVRLQDWLDTVRAVRQVSPWPIELSSHHRWFTESASGNGPCVPCVLPDLGVQGVSLMIYTRNTDRSLALAGDAARRWPRLQFRLAQSMEKQLAPDETWAGVSRKKIGEAMQAWKARLQPVGIHGVDWQAWDDYRREMVEVR